ncbi:hypothetical protein HPB48_026626 [Haemaphysalis longicornis]|uniref:Bursicon subunit alpha n=2 Tax=Ixodidae TaxID=6939 RepID=A0A9J6HCB5_HAELO|nr:hypothetical protein HPB48_026626 [Haemaphysalis longicornis]
MLQAAEPVTLSAAATGLAPCAQEAAGALVRGRTRSLGALWRRQIKKLDALPGRTPAVRFFRREQQIHAGEEGHGGQGTLVERAYRVQTWCRRRSTAPGSPSSASSWPGHWSRGELPTAARHPRSQAARLPAQAHTVFCLPGLLLVLRADKGPQLQAPRRHPRQVSGSRYWQVERSCMCCQEMGEREATKAVFCPKGPGPKFRKLVTRAPVECMCRPCTAPDEASVLPQEFVGL